MSEPIIREKGTRIYRIKSKGGIEELEVKPENLKNVRIVVDHERKIIWLWKESENVPVKLRFLGAHEVKKLQSLYPTYKLKDVTAGDEPKEFFEAIENPTGEYVPKGGFEVPEEEETEEKKEEKVETPIVEKETEKVETPVPAEEKKSTSLSAASLLLGVGSVSTTSQKSVRKTTTKAAASSAPATTHPVTTHTADASKSLIVRGKLDGKEVKYEIPIPDPMAELIENGENVIIAIPLEKVKIHFEKKEHLRQCYMCEEWFPESELVKTKRGKYICKKCLEELKSIA